MQMKAEQIEEALIKALDGAPGKRIEDLLTDPRRLHMMYIRTARSFTCPLLAIASHLTPSLPEL
jgi:hypothetical protein